MKLKTLVVAIAASILLAACSSSTSETVSNSGDPSDQVSDAAIENRFFDDVEGFRFLRFDPGEFVRPTVSTGGGLLKLGLGEANSDYPLTSYLISCGVPDSLDRNRYARVYTFAASQPREELASQAEGFRTSNFEPGAVSELMGTRNGEPVSNFTYEDHVRGIDPASPTVTSRQWSGLPSYKTAEEQSVFETGAWVVTSFITDDGVQIELLVISGDVFNSSWPWDGGPGKTPLLEELADTPNDPTINWRFDCVADTWELIEPIVTDYQQRNQ